MKYNPRIHHRRSTRLKGYNYARADSYFVTLNCHNRIHLFGEISDAKMSLNDFGILAHQEWIRTPEIRPNIDLGAFIIMPDHIHGIIIIREDASCLSYRDRCNTSRQDKQEASSNFSCSRGVLHPPRLQEKLDNTFISPSQTLGAIIRGYLGTVTRQINELRNTPGDKVWQRNYHDHIIRNKWSFHRITNYIIRNPLNYNRE